MTGFSLSAVLVLAALLFAVGLYGLLSRRNLIGMLLCVELMLNAANVNLVGFARFESGDPASGALLSVFSIAIAGAEMAVALAILVAMHRRRRTLDADELNELQG